MDTATQGKQLCMGNLHVFWDTRYIVSGARCPISVAFFGADDQWNHRGHILPIPYPLSHWPFFQKLHGHWTSTEGMCVSEGQSKVARG